MTRKPKKNYEQYTFSNHFQTSFKILCGNRKEIENRHWEFLKSKECLRKLFNEQPVVAYMRPKTLRDSLVSTKFKTKKPKASPQNGCKSCGKTTCTWCSCLQSTRTFRGTRNNREFDMLHKLTC